MDTHIKKAGRTTRSQLRDMYDEDTITGILSKVPVFRAMHVQGRLLHDLIPGAVDDVDAYEYHDGEFRRNANTGRASSAASSSNRSPSTDPTSLGRSQMRQPA